MQRLATAAQKMFGIIFLLIIKDSYCCDELQTESSGQYWCWDQSLDYAQERQIYLYGTKFWEMDVKRSFLSYGKNNWWCSLEQFEWWKRSGFILFMHLKHLKGHCVTLFPGTVLHV